MKRIIIIMMILFINLSFAGCKKTGHVTDQELKSLAICIANAGTKQIDNITYSNYPNCTKKLINDINGLIENGVTESKKALSEEQRNAITSPIIVVHSSNECKDTLNLFGYNKNMNFEGMSMCEVYNNNEIVEYIRFIPNEDGYLNQYTIFHVTSNEEAGVNQIILDKVS